MTEERATALKVLLRERHGQEHRAFCRAYDEAAREVDRTQVGGAPSKATFYRWLSGDLRGLPHPAHCRVLERMFPGWTADALFTAAAEHRPAPRAPESGPLVPVPSSGLAGIEAAFASRAAFARAVDPRELFDGARELRVCGLSLNELCQRYGDRDLTRLLETGCSVACLFLDPRGTSVSAREDEEGHRRGHLASLTEVNIQVLERLRADLDPSPRERLQIRTYDEPVRFNITLVDRTVCVVQLYLPHARGIDSPTLVVRGSDDPTGLQPVFEGVFTSLWERATPR